MHHKGILDLIYFLQNYLFISSLSYISSKGDELEKYFVSNPSIIIILKILEKVKELITKKFHQPLNPYQTQESLNRK